MKITLKTGGLLKRYLPDSAEGNTGDIEVPDGLSILGVLEHLGAPTDGNYLIIINGDAVPPSTRGDMVVNDGDSMSLMPPLKGG